MSETELEDVPNGDSKTKCFLDIEHLWLDGNQPRAIAIELRLKPRAVGQFLRAIRRRYGKRLSLTIQQQRAEALAYYESIYREAMSGWRRSQHPKATTTNI